MQGSGFVAITAAIGLGVIGRGFSVQLRIGTVVLQTRVFDVSTTLATWSVSASVADSDSINLYLTDLQPGGDRAINSGYIQIAPA
ncbi:hypothetical protein [Gordonia phthalatica]|uniref:Uncharacterized protein n=1 Tax=Gordonia phthalatica TaxID=1136941 RepID=A0A0N9N9J8_9ACTN|nr:hypothetical protein [Gordonia phthalatica]ALG83899.1 hypothetical protein ACH46_04435 [Gordonia phthalatica]